MFGHWILSAWRAFCADKLFALLCILSLGAGAAACLLVGAYAHEELTYEHRIAGSESVVRLQTDIVQPNGEEVASASTLSGLARAVAEAASGVNAWTRISPQYHTVRVGAERTNERIAFVDPGFFAVFPLRFIEGDPGTALSTPDKIVITESVRERLFGNASAVGQTIELDTASAVVSGVIADLPRATHLRAPGDAEAPMQMIAPVSSPNFSARGGGSFDEAFSSLNAYAYFRAAPGAPVDQFARQLSSIAGGEFRRRAGADDGQRVSFPVTPIREIHLASQRSNDISPVADISQLVLFAIVAAALLFVAAFNYVSMSLARALRRTREVGLRKVVGASRSQLVQQYLSESAAFTFIAIVLGFAAAELVAPWFGEAIGSDLDLGALHNPMFLVWAGAAVVILALIVGAYPALYLSNFRPSEVLQGRSSGGAMAPSIMRALVGVQFAAAATLLTAVFIVGAQIRYVQDQPLGFESADRITLHGTRRDPASTASNLETFKQILSASPAIVHASGAEQMPDWEADTFADLTPSGGAGGAPVRALALRVDFDYSQVLGMSLLAGRFFDQGFGADRAFLDQPGAQPDVVSVVVTRSALPALGVDSPTAALSTMATLDAGRGPMTIQVVGVVDDLHYRSLRSPMAPTILLPDQTAMNAYVIQHRAGQRDAAMAAIQSAWNRVFPDQLISSQVLQEQMAQLYAADARMMRLIVACAVATVLVSALGLYGLAGFVARSRTREIGLRKAMGATSGSVMGLMLMRFLTPVLLACAIGWPLALIMMDDWLSAFAYRAPLTPLPFVLAAGITFTLALIAVGATTAAAANTRPSVALRAD